MTPQSLMILWSNYLPQTIISLFYLFQGIQLGFYFFVLPSYLVHKSSEVDISTLMVAVNLPWSLKIFLSPLVDRYFSRKTWILTNQLLIVLLFSSLSLINFDDRTLLALTALASLLFATQDIAQDAYSIECHGGHLRTISGTMEVFKKLGTIVGAIGCGFMLHHFNLAACFLLLALFYLVAFTFNSFSLSSYQHTKATIAYLLRAPFTALKDKENFKVLITSVFLILPTGFIHVVFTQHCLTTMSWDKWEFISRVGLWAPLGGLVGGLTAIILVKFYQRQGVLSTSALIQVPLLLSLMIFDIDGKASIVSLFVFCYQLTNALLLASIVGIIFEQSTPIARATTITTFISWINLCFLGGTFLAAYTIQLTFVQNLSLTLCMIIAGVIYWLSNGN